MSESSWYEVVDEDRLLQGDVLMNCPVVTVADQLQWPRSTDMAGVERA